MDTIKVAVVVYVGKDNGDPINPNTKTAIRRINFTCDPDHLAEFDYNQLVKPIAIQALAALRIS